MGDLIVNGDSPLEDQFPELRRKRLEIYMNEKQAQIVALRQELENMKNIRQKKLELKH